MNLEIIETEVERITELFSKARNLKMLVIRKIVKLFIEWGLRN